MTNTATTFDHSRQQEQQQQQQPKPAPGARKAAIKAQAKADKARALRSAREGKLSVGELMYLAADDGLTAVILYTNKQGQPCACGFRRSSLKAAFAYRYCNAQEREKYVSDWLTAENTRIAEKAAIKGSHSLKVGDVLYTSWGYEQTNVDFYEVTAVRGAVVDLVEIAQDRTPCEHGMQGKCRPRKGEHIGYALIGKRPNARNQVRITSFATACVWDGREKAWSSYA